MSPSSAPFRDAKSGRELPTPSRADYIARARAFAVMGEAF